jgi:chromosome transmission fidelity protein 1
MFLANDEPEWIVEQANARKRRELLRQREEMEARLAKIRTKEKAQREKYLRGEPNSKRRKTGDKEKAGDGEDEDQFVLDDYDSDREGDISVAKENARNGLSAETLALMENLGMNLRPPKEEEQELEDEIKVVAIFHFCMSCADGYRFSTVRGRIHNCHSSSMSCDA